MFLSCYFMSVNLLTSIILSPFIVIVNNKFFKNTIKL
nr:MAG TPA: hypothetical protein [Bacteriophage sp.]DAS83233.1 MAG TPA: hypothetical protein [Caudoviricetes sp.]DAZ80814.1 MAG TPA: hypothetical protein [Caudoviricetes sp.]